MVDGGWWMVHLPLLSLSSLPPPLKVDAVMICVLRGGPICEARSVGAYRSQEVAVPEPRTLPPLKVDAVMICVPTPLGKHVVRRLQGYLAHTKPPPLRG